MRTTADGARATRRGGFRADRRRSNVELLVLCLPVIVVLFLFQYLPIHGIILAFKSYKPLLGVFGSPWVGLRNFEFFFRSPLVWKVTRNTILYSLAFITLTPVCSVTVAILLYEIQKAAWIKLYQTVFFLPYFLSWVVVSIIVYAFLNSDHGLTNKLIVALGGSSLSWYTTPRYWPFIIVFMGLWKGVGYNTVVYYAGLVGIDPGLFEAAAIDGASRLQRTLHVTIPMIIPLAIVLSILGLGRMFFSDFGLHFQVPLNSGPLLPATDVINYFTYRALMELQDYGMGTAMGLYQSAMGLLLVLGSNWAARKISEGEHGLF